MSPFRRLSLAVAALFTLAAPTRADVPALAVALDNPALTWNTGGDEPWFSQSTVTKDGVDAAKATGLAALDSTAWIQTTVTAPGFLSWQWRLDLAADSGAVLELMVGDSPIPSASLGAATDWSGASVTIEGSGAVPVRWRLRRVAQADEATADAAYLDTVSYAAFGPPVLQTPLNLAARGFTARWNTVAQATTYTVEVSSTVDFTSPLASVTVSAPAVTAAITGLAPSTTYYHRVIAQGPGAISSASTPLGVTTPVATRPANDAFAAATALSGVSGSVNSTTLEATVETDEPGTHRGSVWFNWTAPGPGLWRFEATTANGAPSPVLFVYDGAALADLDLVAFASDGTDAGTTRAEFRADAGVAYRIALDADLDDQAATTLSWTRLAAYTPPANDAFAAPTTLSGASGTVDTTNLYAGAEAGEPGAATHSIWFTWKAPASGVWTLQSTGSAVPATLSVWSGSTLAGLSLLATDSAAAPAASRVSLAVVKDATYRVSLDGQNGAEGALRLGWSLAVPTVAQTITPPEIADQPIDAPAFSLEGFSSSGLPLSYLLLSGPATLDGDLLSLTGQPGTVKLRALQAGDATYLAAQIDFGFVVRTPPANDRIGSAQNLAAPSGALDLDLRYATNEASDAFPANRSLWFRWAAAATGILTLDTVQSASPVVLSIFAGPATNPSLVVAEVRPDLRPRLEVPVSAGVEYFVAVDTLSEAPGLARLAWSFAAPSLAQTIEFPAPPNLGVSAAPFALEATASSGLPVQFALLSGPAVLDGNLLKLTGKPGKVTLRASQPGDFTYQAAPVVIVSFEVLPPPANDAAANAIRLSGASGVVTGSNIDATSELIDPAPANRSVWWRWTAPATGKWTVDTAGSGQPVTLSILSGLAPEALTPLGSDLPPGGYGKLVVPVYSGLTYWIALDTLDDSVGALRLSWSLAAPSLGQTILFDQDLPNLVVGDPAPVLSPSASSGLPVSVAVVSGPARMAGDTLVLTGKPGVVTLRATQTGDADYKAAPPVTRSFTVADFPAIKITLSDLRQTYDGTPKAVGVVTAPLPRSGEPVITYNGSGVPPTKAGTYTVVVTADKSKATAKLVIAKAPLLVSAENQRKLAGQPNPPFTLIYSGFVPGDDPSRLARAPVAATTAKLASPGGSYPIKVSGGSSADYAFTYSPGILTVDTFAGRYEGLLIGFDSLPLGRLELSVASSGTAFTGKLTLARELAPLAFKGTLSLDAFVDLAEATVQVPGKAGAYTLALGLLLDGRMDASLQSAADGLFATTPGGRRLFTPAAKEKLAWAGAHTAILAPASESGLLAPAGTGYATATVDSKGSLKLSGRLADDTPFTATLAPDPDGGYRLFATPYAKRTDSFLAGDFTLVPHPDSARFPGRRYLPAATGTALTWAKAAKESDLSYPAGFGPLSATLVIDPWVRHSTATPITLAFGPLDLDLGERASALPVSGSLSSSGAFTPAQSAATTRFSLKVNPATGTFSGSFVLSDQVAPAPASAEQRSVTFGGVLRRPSETEPASGTLLGAGYFLLKPLSNSGLSGRFSGDIRLEKP